jgi:hypothetical protein
MIFCYKLIYEVNKNFYPSNPIVEKSNDLVECELMLLQVQGHLPRQVNQPHHNLKHQGYRDK